MAVNINVLSQFDNKGIKAATAELDRLKAATESTSQKMLQGAQIAGAAMLAGAAAVGAALYGIGEQFDAAFDHIRIGTGATGDVLEGLKGDMKKIASEVPTSFGDAGTAVTELNRRLGLSGQPLQTLSEQLLELSRMTKTDLTGNIAAVAQVMQNFNVATGDQSGKLDLLFRASQKSGVSVADLASQMSDAGVVLRDLGMGFDQSAALLATLGKAGIDTGDVMPALSKSMATAAKQGKDASVVFADTFAAIKNAPNDVAASGVALEVFGAKAGPKLAAMIREGKLSFEDMAAAIGNGDSILKASKDTQDFGEKLTILKNRVFLAIEPIATRVFNAIGDAMDKIGPKVEQATKWLTEHGAVLKVIAGVVGAAILVFLAAYTASMISAAVATVAATWPILAIIAAIALLVAGVMYAWQNWGWFREAVLYTFNSIRNGAIYMWENVLKPIWEAIVWYIQNLLIPYYKMLWEIVKFVFEAIGAYISFVWGNIISPAFNFIKGGIETLIDVFGMIKDGVSTAFSGIFEIVTWPFRTAFNFIADAWNNTVGSLSFSVPDWVPFVGGKGFDMPKIPKLHQGGIFQSNSPAGEGLALLKDGEMVLTAQQQQTMFTNSPSVNVVINTVAGDPAAIERVVLDAIGRAHVRGMTALKP